MLAQNSANPPQIVQYLDYRIYLDDWFRWRKDSDPDFSLRTFARRPELALSSSSFLSAVLKGRKNLSQSLRLRFARALGLEAGERDYFEILVQHNQSRSAGERDHFAAQLSRFHNSRARILDASLEPFLARWPVRLVWAWLSLRPDRSNPARIANSLVPLLSPEEVQEALRTLLDLRLIKRLANGYALTDRHLTTGPRHASARALEQERAVLRLALEALGRTPAPARHYASLVFTLSERGFGRLRERMDAFRAEVRELVEADEGGDRVMALSLQAFPLSRVETGAAGPVGRGGRPKGGVSSDAGNPLF